METEAQTKTVDDLESESKPWYLNWKTWLKILILVLLLSALIVAIIFRNSTTRILESFLNWMRDNAAAGSFAFIAIYWFATVMFIPGLLLTLGAGVVFREVAGPAGGIFLATLVVLVGAALGASTAFLLAKFVFREKVESYKSKYEKFDIIDKVVEQQGFKVTLLLRLSPLIPFNAFNYFMGLTGVSFKAYNLAHIGMLPGTMAYCFIGGTIGAIGSSAGSGFDNPLVLTFTIVGTVIAIAGMVYISYVAKKEFNKIAEQHQQNAMDADPEDGMNTNTNNTENGITSNKSKEQVNDNEDDNDNDDEEPEQSLSLGT